MVVGQDRHRGVSARITVVIEGSADEVHPQSRILQETAEAGDVPGTSSHHRRGGVIHEVAQTGQDTGRVLDPVDDVCADHHAGVERIVRAGGQIEQGRG
jgi:hypothetical protein